MGPDADESACPALLNLDDTANSTAGGIMILTLADTSGKYPSTDGRRSLDSRTSAAV